MNSDNSLDLLRQKIDRLDYIIADALRERYLVVKEIASYKKEHSLPVKNEEREQKVISRFTEIAGENSVPVIQAVIQTSTELEKQ